MSSSWWSWARRASSRPLQPVSLYAFSVSVTPRITFNLLTEIVLIYFSQILQWCSLMRGKRKRLYFSWDSRPEDKMLTSIVCCFPNFWSQNLTFVHLGVHWNILTSASFYRISIKFDSLSQELFQKKPN